MRWKLQKSPRLQRKHWAFCVVYTSVFPLTSWLGGGLQTVGLFLTIPFLPLAWIGGMAAVSLANSDSFYLLGATLTIFAQVFIGVYCFLARKERKQAR